MSKLKAALEKAKEKRERQFKNFTPALRRTAADPEKEQPDEDPNGDMEASILEVKYTKTKIHKIDQNNLWNNNILALFKDNDTNDQIKLLRTQILNKLKSINGNTIMVTSANPGEGKTFVSINLGVSIAQQLDKTALIVDADLRQPWKHHKSFSDDFWGIKTDKGLSDYFMGHAEIEDILINPSIEKLTIIPGGRITSNSAEYFASSKMEKLVKQLKKRYKERIIIFDCPSILTYSDPLVFSHLIDGILLVIEAERTQPDEIKKAVSLLKGCNIIGCIYNKSRERTNL
jgi:protein-tyrosine kinase